MSVVKSKSHVAEYPYPKVCFYCGKKVKYPFVHWMGSGDGDPVIVGGVECTPSNDIALHPNCVGRLFTRLLRDVEEIQGGPNG